MMRKKIKVVILLFIVLVCLFLGYFFFLSPQSQKSLSVEGTMVQTLRNYEGTKYPFYMSHEILTAPNVDNPEQIDEYTAIHFHYLPITVSIEDFQNYVRALQNEGFLVITAVNPSLLEGNGCFYELAKPLTGEGYTILITVNYNYARKLPTISYMKLPGEAEKLNPEESQDE